MMPNDSSTKKQRYNLWRLLDSQDFRDLGSSLGEEQIICDIDKTYLETDFESLIKMAKIAFEDARDKVTVKGATEVLLALRWGFSEASMNEEESKIYPRPLHFVSSSPPQLRKVLEAKLRMDGLDWSSDSFKNQAYNIRKRRFDLLKQQVAYKSAAILKVLYKSDAGQSFFMLGDNAESDAYIYIGVKLFSEKRLSEEAYARYLEFAKVDIDDGRKLAVAFKNRAPKKVPFILIRKLAAYKLPTASPLSDPIFLFDNYFEVVLHFLISEKLDPRCIWSLVKEFRYNMHLSLNELYSMLSGAKKCLKTGEAAWLSCDEALQAIRAHCTEFNETATFSFSQKKNLTAFEALDEEQILSLAKEWQEALASEEH